jgi:nucleotide-binding universal stress UspA family protein
MYRILLPVDSDKARAMSAAKVIGKIPIEPNDIAITILNIHEPVEVSGSEGGPISSEDWYDEGDMPESVTKVAAFFEDLGATVELRREHAEPAGTILDVATEIDADNIVMSGRKRSPVGKVIFGSVTQSVLLDADRPVTVVPI